jgi:hypothetical protein
LGFGSPRWLTKGVTAERRNLRVQTEMAAEPAFWLVGAGVRGAARMTPFIAGTGARQKLNRLVGAAFRLGYARIRRIPTQGLLRRRGTTCLHHLPAKGSVPEGRANGEVRQERLVAGIAYNHRQVRGRRADWNRLRSLLRGTEAKGLARGLRCCYRMRRSGVHLGSVGYNRLVDGVVRRQHWATAGKTW